MSAMSRIKKRRDKRRAVILKALQQGCTLHAAATAAGVCQKTLRRWCDADPEFADKVEEARDAAFGVIEKAAYDAATDPNPANNTMRIFLLKCGDPHLYNDKVNEPPPQAPALAPEVVAAVFATIQKVMDGPHAEFESTRQLPEHAAGKP